MKLKIQDLVDEMDMQSDSSTCFYQKSTGAFILYNEYETDLNDYDIDELDESDDFIPIPSKFAIHEYKIMKDFCYSIPNEEIKQQAIDAIQGNGAFRKFKDLIYGGKFENLWYAFKEDQLKEQAIEWCKSVGLEFEK